VICSQARLTYTEVAAILANTRGPEAVRRDDLVPDLLNLHEVYRALLKERGRRGPVDFETTETQIVCDENGRIEKIVPRTRTEAHKLIEETMLAANVCAADFIARAKHPSLYRVHEGPDAGEADAAAELPARARPRPDDRRRSGAGRVPGRRRRDEGPARRRPDPHDAAALDAAGDLHRRQQRPLRTRVRGLHALHEPDPALSRSAGAPGHQGAAAGQALHAADRAEQPRAGFAQGSPRGTEGGSADEMQWETAGIHCSANERRADEASRDVEAWLKCRYMREHLGEEYGGTVSAVTSFGLFVTLDGLYVEGLVHITELGGEYYRFDEVRQELRGERSGVRYAVGSRVRVQVSRVDLDGRKIDFRLVRDGEDPALARRTRRDRGGDKTAAAAKELAAVKEADRAVRKASKARAGSTGDPGRAGRPAKSAAGKSGPRSPVKASGRR
jgi:ribonuclease R